MDKARELCDKFNLLSTENPILAERIFQDQGYRFLRTGQTSNAIELFKMGTEAYPNSANSWDCLAEAYMASRNNEMAIKYYKKTLEVLPNDTTTSGELKNIIRTNTPEILQRLEQQN
ncbi:MAG: tetratricopeptide repeat protein [candidate division Zixibacteria bacterium]|nr:tetratricopeptide repeat protein [candidate division Zixibacteria bacterium]